MRHLGCLAVFVIANAPMLLLSAPAPKQKNAKPAVISAGTELRIRSMQEMIPLLAPHPFPLDQKAREIAIIRKHITVWKPLQKKEWDAFVKWLRKNLRIERVKDKNLVRISFQEGNAEEQAAIINIVVDYYLKEIDSRRDGAKRGLQMLRDLKEQNRRDPQKTKEDVAKSDAESDKAIKKQEEYIQAYPKLVERAKAR